MRRATFLSAVLVFSTFPLALSHFLDQPRASVPVSPNMPQVGRDNRSGDGERMVTRAVIRVVPLDVLTERTDELESLRSRISRSEMDALRATAGDPATREILLRQHELVRALLHYAERQDSDEGKSVVAIQVQRQLNEIEGRVNCQACHSGMIAGRAGH